MALRGLGYSVYHFPPSVDGDLVLTNATGGDLTTVLTAAKRYRNITINATSTGKQILQFGARVDLGCTGTLTLTNNKCIIDASGGAGGVGAAPGTGGGGIFPGAAGGAGKTSGPGNGTVGVSLASPTIGGGGGAGGGANDGAGHVTTGGAGGAVAYTHLDSFVSGFTRETGSLLVHTAGAHPQTETIISLGGGAGGGGGGLAGVVGGGGAGAGGGGGGGAKIDAQIIDISGGGIIRANGGPGGNPDPALAGDPNEAWGGGGGGGGGVVWLNYGELRKGSGLTQVLGGAGAAGTQIGTGSGSTGAVGQIGKIILWSEFGPTVT